MAADAATETVEHAVPAVETRHVVVAAPAVAAAPAAAFAPPPASRAPARAAAHADEPAVRVHIGRLEVRANLQQPPAQHTPRTAPPAAPGLSLGDYLRGRRTG